LICSAAKLAIDDSRLTINEENTHFTGVSIGTTFGSLHSISQFDRSGLIEGPRAVNPSRFPNTVINSPASQVSIRFKIKGFNTTLSTGFCASLDAISYAQISLN
jgi:3-oxoacyl-[acyl-carrier-protein] synthase II